MGRRHDYDALVNLATLAVTDDAARASLSAAWAVADRIDREHTIGRLRDRIAIAESVSRFGHTPTAACSAAQSALAIVQAIKETP